MTFKLHMIAAMGRNGALGYQGKLPWHKPDDLRLFQQLTTNCNIIVGKRTSKTLPSLPNRAVHVWTDPEEPAQFLANLTALGEKSAWLCGGAHTYRIFAPYVNGNRVINYIDYDGEYDTVFPFDAYGMQGW